MNIQKVSIDTIKGNTKNPRKIDEGNYQKLVKSLKEFPEMLDIRPIVIDEDNVVLGGNMRLKALKEIGIKEVPVIKVSELTEEQKKEFVLKDNNNFGYWDTSLLEDYTKDMLLKSGFEEWDLIDIFGENDMEANFTGNVEGSNFDNNIVNVDDYIKQNIIFLNEIMLEFQDDEIKNAIRNMGDTTYFLEDLKKLILKYGGKGV